MYSRFTFLENSVTNSPKVLTAKFMGSEKLFCFSSICKFGSFKNPFSMITSLSELHFRFWRFTQMFVQMKKVISMNYSSSKSCWKPWRWVTFDLILTMKYMYISFNLNPLTKFTSSSRSTEFKDILPWNISQMITKTIPISTRIVISYAMKWGILLWISWKVNENWDNNMIRISQWREAIVEQILASEERREEIQKSRTVIAIVRDLSRKVNYISKIVLDWKIIAEFTRSISSTRIG